MSRLVASLLLAALFTSTAVAGPFASPPPDPTDKPAVGDPVEVPLPPDDIVVSREAVRDALATRRARSVKLFRAYYKKGIYPHNTYTDGELNVWLDESGNLCAAATIIANSGLRDQVLAQSVDDNFIRLIDVEDGWLMDWMLTSGLTQEELVMIQVPFMPGEPRLGDGPVLPIRPMPDPAPMPIADPFAAADKKLRKRYVKIDRTLAKQSKASLEIAVDRLMERPELAKQLLLGA
jgi:hypothetical protein